MRLTFYTRDERLFVLEIGLDQDIQIPETGDDAYQQKKEGEIGLRSQLPVHPCSQKETSEDGEHHGDADATRKGHLDRGFFRLLVHHTFRNTIGV
jgi:hypothetical protein